MKSEEFSAVPIRWHLWSSFFRVFAFNFALLYAQTIFITQVGAENYGVLFLFITSASLAVYLGFLYLSDHHISRFYLILVLLSLISVVPFLISIKPPAFFVFLWVMVVGLADLAGKNVLSSMVQLSTHPAIFRDVLNRVVSYELAGRILSSSFLLLLTRYFNLQTFVVVFVIVTGFHFAYFVRVHKNIRYNLENISLGGFSAKTQSILQSGKFFLTHKFLKVILIIVAWSYLAKFLVEFIFFRSTQETFSGVSEIGPLLSIASLAAIILTFGVQRLVSKYLAKALKLSTLLYILPSTVLATSLLFLFPIGIIPAALLHVSFIIFNKSIQRPSTRQCFVIVPNAHRKNVLFLLPIILALVGALCSGLIVLVKNHLSTEGVLLVLVAITCPLLLFPSNLDTQYVRSLWSKFTETIDANSLVEDESDLARLLIEQGNQSPTPMDNGIEVSTLSNSESQVRDYLINILVTLSTPESARSDQMKQTMNYLSVLYDSYDKRALSVAVSWHKSLLLSSKHNDRKLGLALCEVLGLRCMDQVLENFRESETDKELINIADLILKTNAHLSRYHLVGLPLSAQIKFRYLYGKYIQSNRHSEMQGLTSLIKLPNKLIAKVFLDAIFSKHFKAIRPELISCLVDVSNNVNINNVCKLLLSADPTKAKLAEDFLRLLPGDSFKHQVSKRLAMSCDELYSQNFNIWSDPTTEKQLFLSSLFLEHWLINSASSSSAMFRSLGSILDLGTDQKLMLATVHLEELKKSQRSGYWRSFLQLRN